MPWPGPRHGCAPHLPTNASDARDPGVALATFMHSVNTRVYSMKFAHQSLCNPKISTFLETVQWGFLKGCPNLSERLILKYLNPSSTMTKATWNAHGTVSAAPIWTEKSQLDGTNTSNHPTNDATGLASFCAWGDPRHTHGPQHHHRYGDELIANIFCFGTFADYTSGVVYHDLTGSFPIMSFNESMCCFVLYHYKPNAIPARPISGLDNISIFNAYKK